MVGEERFGLALQSEGRKSVETDWQIISQFKNFQDGFRAIGQIAAVAGWGEWVVVSLDEKNKLARFRVRDSWEGRYQKSLGVCWGSGMLAGKLAGYCSKLFGTNCWAEQTAFIAKGDPGDEFEVRPSDRSIEKEIEGLLVADGASRADMAVALQKLREEISIRQRTENLLQIEKARFETLSENAPFGMVMVDKRRILSTSTPDLSSCSATIAPMCRMAGPGSGKHTPIRITVIRSFRPGSRIWKASNWEKKYPAYLRSRAKTEPKKSSVSYRSN